MQYLATKRLKALKWMFHKKYQTWFQIIGQPKNQTNEFIEGTFYYFDFERGI
jgi:CCR4-NOT transcriptional regulation complex NOT5 subunit